MKLIDSYITEDHRRIEQDLFPLLPELGGKTILLLGGSGFLGTSFRRFFSYLNRGVLQHVPITVISVDNYIKDANLTDEYDDVNVHYVKHDLVFPLGVKISNVTIHFIINCAGNASPRMYAQYPLETMDVSTIGTRHILELAYLHKAKVLHFSSSEVLGDADIKDIPTGEEIIPRVHSMNKRSPYDVTKLYIETVSWIFRENYGVDCKVIRPFNIIGYFDQKDKRVISNYFDKLFRNEPLEVFVPGTQTRTFCFYTDFIVGTMRVLLCGKDILYHIGNSNNEISMIDLATKIATLEGKPDLVRLVETPEVYRFEPQRRCPSITKARQELGFQPRVDLTSMLTRIHAWAKQNYMIDPRL